MRRNVVYHSSPRLFYQESHLNNILGALVRGSESHDRRLHAADQIREWLKQVDPSKVNPKMIPKIVNMICRAFVWRQKDLRVELVECLRLLGKNLGDFTALYFYHMRLLLDPETKNNEQQGRISSQFPGVPDLSEDEKSLIMKPLAENVQYFVSAKPEVLTAVITELAIFLAHVNSPDAYISIVGMLSSTLPQYVELLGSYFNDIIDVCIGWYISTSPRRETIRRETERLLMLLHPLWNYNQPALVNFLMQFSEDLEKYYEDYKAEGSSEYLDKIFSLLEIFKILCDSSTGGRSLPNSAVTSLHAAAIAARLCLAQENDRSGDTHQRLLSSVFSSLASFISLLPPVQFCELIMLHQYILSHLPSNERTFQVSTTVSYLKLVSRAVRVVGTNSFPECLTHLLSASSPLFTVLPCCENCEVVEGTIDVMHAAFASKQATVVTQIYGHLVERLKLAFAELAHGKTRNSMLAERQLLFGLASIRRIAVDKMDLFGVHLFSPTIFELLSRDIRPFGGPSGIESAHNLALNSGVVQTAIFSLLVGHMQGHSYFVTNSELVEDRLQQETGKRTSKYLTKFLEELTHILSSDAEYVDSVVRVLALKATTEVIAQIYSYRPAVLRHEIILRLLNSVVRSTVIEDREALLLAINCLSALFPYAKFISRRIFVDLFEVCLLHLGSSDDAIAARTLHLVEQLAISLQTGHLLEENALPSVAESIECRSERSLQSPFSNILIAFSSQFRSPAFQCRTISPVMFSTVISYLLQASNSRPKLSMLLDLHSLAQSDGNSTTAVPRFYFMAWLLTLCGVASHCVVSKLKTPLGKPQDTLLALELELKRLADETTSPSLARRLPLSSATTALDQHRRLIDLLDHLERSMYNAFEGTAVVSASLPKTIRSFFVTNRATCEEWLGRIRLSAMTTAWASGAYEAAIRHGMEILADWRRTGSQEVRSRLVYVVICLTRCFCKLRIPALISGLHALCLEAYNRRFSWLKPAVTFCAERYEHCVNQATQRLDDFMVPSDQPLSDRLIITEFLLKLCVECFEALHDWEAFEMWREGVVRRLQGSEIELIANETLSSSYLADVANLHSFNFAQLASTSLPENSVVGKYDVAASVAGWGFEDVVRSVRRQNIRLIAMMAENDTATARPSLEQQSQSVRDAVSQLVRVTTSASGLPSVACLRDLATALMENRLATSSNTTKGEMDVSLMAALCDDYFASNIAPDSTVLAQAIKTNGQLSLKAAIDVTTLTKFRQHLTETYVCGDHCLINAAAVRLARKQGLGGFASKLLLSQLQNHVYLIGGEIPPETPDRCIDQLTQIPVDTLRTKCRSVFTLRCEYVKLFRDAGHSLEAADAALSFALSAFSPQTNNTASLQLVSSCCAKQLLNLAKWLQTDGEFANAIINALNGGDTGAAPEVEASLTERLVLLKQLMDQSLPLSKLSLGHVMMEQEHLTGQLLAMAANQSPTCSKAWMQLAGWCHYFGRKAIGDASQNGLQLSEEEHRTVVNCLPPSVTSDHAMFTAIISVITKLDTTTLVSTADSDEARDSDYRRDSSVIEQQIVTACPVLAQSPDTRAVLMAVWRAARQRLFTLYNMAAVAYFSFVNLNPQITEQTALASLRLLRLLAKHAWELQAILENGLQNSPVGPWRAIVPQLFARLGHPEPYVRRAIADLLCRIASTAPHEIVYPAVAGFYTYGGNVQSRLNNSQLTLQSSPPPSQSPSSTCRSQQQQQSEDLKACYSQLVEALALQNASLVSQVSDFVFELTRIAVLWDELVLNILAAHQSVISRRFSQLNDELAATFAAVDRHHLTKNEGATVAHWKHATYMKPLLAFFEAVRQLTSSREPETDHERWFSSTLLPILDSTIQALHKPRQLGKSARHSQMIVKQLLTALQQGSAGLQAAGAALNLEFMSPSLVTDKFKDAAIPLPGNAVTLYAVEPQIYILPTKTKPKKISFIGSDGKTYTYLLKGIEDLHLDERMMQLLRLVNTTFTHQPGFRARNYAVTPLGRRSGLIQWVDDVTPAFTVYKRWQQRNAARTAADPSAPGQVPRPADLYFGATSALSKKAGISAENRRDKIPTSIQRRALEQLVTETPADLMARELWSSCANSPDWFRKLSAFNKSVATMSIVGYIIGLGDRHLDNILIDIARGEVVHIDYNVCFEKGLRLRIPERVPFRMSQNIECALGIFGCEGLFRSACEYVMNQMRRSRELLLTLLEAFIYDPLIDWTVSDTSQDQGDVSSLDHLLPRPVIADLYKMITSKTIQLQQDDLASSSLTNDSNVDLAAFRQDYTSYLVNVFAKLAPYREDIRSFSSSLPETLIDFSSVLHAAQLAVGEHQKLEARVALLRDCWQLLNDQTSRQHLSTLPDRMHLLSVAEAERSKVTQTLASAASEERSKQTLALSVAQFIHNSLVSGTSIAQALRPICSQVRKVSFSQMTTCVHDFLTTTGQDQLLTQLQGLERELDVEVARKFNETFVPLATEALQSFSNRAAPYFTTNSTLCSLYLLKEVESCVNTSQEGNDGVETGEAVVAQLEAYRSILQLWSNNEGVYEKWISLRNAVSESMQASTAVVKTDEMLQTTAQAAFSDLINSPEYSENSNSNSRLLPSIAAFCSCLFSWMNRPMESWLPSPCFEEETATCGLYTPSAVVEFLLTSIHTLGDDIQQSFPSEYAQLLETSLSTLNRLHLVNLALVEASFSFISTLVPKFYNVIMSNRSFELKEALHHGRPEDVQSYIDQLLDSQNSELSVSIKRVSTQLSRSLAELVGEDHAACSIYPRLFVNRAILFADSLACHTVGRLSAFQPHDTLSQLEVPDIFAEVASCVNRLFYDEDTGLYRLVCQAAWQSLAVFLSIANFSFDYNNTEPILSPADICRLFMLDEQWFSLAVHRLDAAKTAFVASKSTKLADIAVAFARTNVATLQAVLTAFEWFNGEALPDEVGSNGEVLITPTMRAVYTQTGEASSCLASIQAFFTSYQNRFAEICAKVVQRLKWAAGSNPDLNENITCFFDEKNKVEGAISGLLQWIGKCADLLQGCHVLQEDRSIKKQLSTISLSLSLIESATRMESLLTEVPQLSEEEKLLSEQFSLKQDSGPGWVDEAKSHFSRMMATEEQRLIERMDAKRKSADLVSVRASAVRRSIKTLNDIVVSVLPIIQSLRRVEDTAVFAGSSDESAYNMFSFSVLGIRMGSFTDHASIFLKTENSALITDPLLFADVQQSGSGIVQSLNDLNGDVAEALSRSCNSDDPIVTLSSYIDTWFADHVEKFINPQAMTTSVSSQKQQSSTSKTQQQSWNQQALLVWQRVRTKLDGRDGISSKDNRLSVAEHVATLITQSRDVDNLAAMYEGWTPWV